MEADHSFTTAACTVYVHISPDSFGIRIYRTYKCAIPQIAEQVTTKG